MPEAKILTRLKAQLAAKGYTGEQGQRIAVSALQRSGNLKKGSTKPTPKGMKRGSMTPAQRAKDRAVKYHGGKPSDYIYHKSTNTVTKWNK